MHCWNVTSHSKQANSRKNDWVDKPVKPYRYEGSAEYKLSLYKHLETRECPDDHQDSENERYYLLTLICHR